MVRSKLCGFARSWRARRRSTWPAVVAVVEPLELRRLLHCADPADPPPVGMVAPVQAGEWIETVVATEQPETEEGPQSCPGGNPIGGPFPVWPPPGPGPWPQPPTPPPPPGQPPEPPPPPPDPEPPDDPDEWHVNVVALGMSEEVEEDPGGFMPVNGDFDEQNATHSGSPLLDNQPHTGTGHRIVANDAELRQATLYVSAPEGNSVAFVAEVRVPKGTVGFEGFVKPQFDLLGWGNQVYVPREFLLDSWFIPIRPMP